MRHDSRTIVITGATGLLGGDLLGELLARDPALRAYALMRDLTAWPMLARRLGAGGARVTAVRADLSRPGLGLAASDRARIVQEADVILHLGADTGFARPLTESRAVNVHGTEAVLALAADCRQLGQFMHVSTAFAVGRRSGLVSEGATDGAHGWVNAYEQGKHEAEARVRSARPDALVVRPSTVVCCEHTGAVRQVNVVHQTFRLYHRGLASMMPGSATTLVDTVPYGYVRDALADLALRPDVRGRTLHLCTGRAALSLGEMLDLTYARWCEDPAWRRRALPRPVLTDLETYGLFERTVLETGDARVVLAAKALSFLVPQLAYPKCFETTDADTLLGYAAPDPRGYWLRMVDHLLVTQWGPVRTGVAA